MNETLVLASASPRRLALLRGIGLDVEARPANVDEPREGAIESRALEAAQRKARAVVLPRGWTLAADTLVEFDGDVLGKPADAAEARAMLSRLSGRTHRVVTAVVVRREPGGAIYEAVESTLATFARLAPEAIDAYVGSGHALGKAGAYGIQDVAGAWVTRIDGSYTNVVGLPLATALRLLSEAGFPLPPALRFAR